MAADGAAVHLPIVDGYARPVRVRARTESIARLAQRDLEAGRREYPEQPGRDYQRPATRGDCESVGLGEPWQPCPFVSCKHNLYLDVDPSTGSIKRNFPDLEVWEMRETCALHVAARGGATLEEVGEIMNLTRERVRQLELQALRAVREGITSREWTALDDALDHFDEARR